MVDKIKAELEAAGTEDEKKAIIDKYSKDLSQETLEEFCGKKLTKENMEMISAGGSASAFYCCAWQ